MNFSEWVDLTPDDEKDTLCLFDAWRAGATAMFLGLVEHDLIVKDIESPEELLEDME